MKKVMFAFVIASTIIGCSKEETIVNNPPVVTNNSNTPIAEKHMPLAIGNYWIYETVTIDTLGNETTSSGVDSVYIEKDTLVNGKTYFILNAPFHVQHVLGTIIRNDNGKILNLGSQGNEITLFSSNNLGVNYRADTIFAGPMSLYATTKTGTSIISKSIASNTYNCYEGITNLIQTIPINSTWKKQEKRYYEKSVGVVAGQYVYYSSPNIMELRLVRHHLN